MRKIYIIQMDTKSLTSKFISLFTMYKYSHVAISFNKNCDIIYSFGRRKLYSIFNGGFVVENKNGKFFNRFNNTKCRIYEISVTNLQYNNLLRNIKYMEKYKDTYGYDYLGIVLRYLRIPVTFKNKYVCSYFVAKLLEDNDICKFDKEVFFVKPKDFSNNRNLNLIYTGDYLMYK